MLSLFLISLCTSFGSAWSPNYSGAGSSVCLFAQPWHQRDFASTPYPISKGTCSTDLTIGKKHFKQNIGQASGILLTNKNKSGFTTYTLLIPKQDLLMVLIVFRFIKNCLLLRGQEVVHLMLRNLFCQRS